MCGIASALNFGPDSEPVDPGVASRLQQHRGPDGGGLWSSENNRICAGLSTPGDRRHKLSRCRTKVGHKWPLPHNARSATKIVLWVSAG
jgi:hypothetical protein